MAHPVDPEGTLRPIVCRDADAMSRRAASLIADRLRADSSLLLCAATGATPTRTYALLAEQCRHEPDLTAELRVLKLDEWYGLGPDDESSCEAYLRRHLLDPLGLPEDRYAGFDGEATDADAECRRIRAWLADEGPIGLCVLGLGLNGHLGFNEPADALPPHAHVARLSKSTRGHAMLARARTRPHQGLTLGLAEILQARHLLLLVSGPEKRDVLHRLLHSPVTPRLPASFLHLHPRVVLLCDRAAAGE